MSIYIEKTIEELIEWQKKVNRKPSYGNMVAKKFQSKVNSLIPDKVHSVITETIKGMVKTVLFGSQFITRDPLIKGTLETREKLVKERINFYKKAAAMSGVGTGAAGMLWSFADFPILLSLKMKFLFDTASLYGFDVRDYKERLYILYVFELAFSSSERASKVYKIILNWDEHVKRLPYHVDLFDWKTFQQEYRDFIDLAKMLQIVPGVGAVVGAVANYKLMDRLGETAMNAYRLRLFNIEKVKMK